jgi:hypothetical protein
MSLREMINEVEVETVGKLRRVLSVCPDDMPVTDAVGELLCLRFYQNDDGDGAKWLEVQ